MPGTREEAIRPDIWLNAVIPGLMRLRQTAIVRGHLGLHSRFQVTLGHSVRSCLKQKKEWMLDGKKKQESWWGEGEKEMEEKVHGYLNG